MEESQLLTLIDKARDISRDEKEQSISFVLGNVGIENENVTREMVEKKLEK